VFNLSFHVSEILLGRGITPKVLRGQILAFAVFKQAPTSAIIFLDFLNLFCEDAPRNKLRGSIKFVFFGPMDQKLWVFEVFR
jgi:hypothetical protein